MRRHALAVVLSSACAVTVLAALGPVAAAVPAPSLPPAPAAGSAAAGQDASAVESSLGLDRAARRLIQRGLNNEGFDVGAPDGLFGPRTRAAIRRWQEARGLPATGYLDGRQAELLRAAAVPTVATADPIEPPIPLAEATAPPGRASGGIPATAEADASAAELLRAAGRPTSPASEAVATNAPAAEPSPPPDLRRIATDGTRRSSSRRRPLRPWRPA